MRAITVILLALLIISSISIVLAKNPGEDSDNGLLIVTTFPNLVKDVELIACPSDKIISLVPLGVDPHTYSLKPEDISLLNKADLIISTGHAPFEINIRQLHQKGVIKGTLIEIPRIPGIMLLNNPATKKTNYHMPIYDPFNYLKFLSYTEKKLEKLNPSCMKNYREKLYAVFRKEAVLLTNSSITNITAVADLPFTQYAVEWLGIHVKYLIVKEQGVQATPQDLMLIEKKLQEKQIGLCIVTSPSVNPASKKLLDLCGKYNVSIIYVPSPLINNSFIDKETRIIMQLHDFIGASTNQSRSTGASKIIEYTYPSKQTYIDLALLLLATILLISMIYVLGGRRS